MRSCPSTVPLDIHDLLAIKLSPLGKKAVRENLQAKEVIVGKGERGRRFILVYNPEEAQKSRATREKTVSRMESVLVAFGDQRGKAHKKNVPALLRTGPWGGT